WARVTGADARVSIAAVRMMNARLRVSSAKAERELGWRHRPLLQTLADEVAWYRARDQAAERAAREPPVRRALSESGARRALER
ncbi:MAG: hypothetical protein ACREID_10050, partial [Planctomycetota bacterium]